MFMITTLYHEPFGWVIRVSEQGGGSSGSGEGRCGGQARPDPVSLPSVSHRSRSSSWKKLLRTNLSLPFDEPAVQFVRLEEQSTRLVG